MIREITKIVSIRFLKISIFQENQISLETLTV